MCDKRAFRGDTELLPRGEGGSEDDLSVFLFLLLVVLVLFLFLILFLTWFIQQIPVPEGLVNMMANVTTVY